MMEVTANGKTFNFPDGTSNDQIGEAIDEYFAGQVADRTSQFQAPPLQQETQPSVSSQLGQGILEAGRATAQAGVDVANIIPTVGDAIQSAAAWAGNKLGIGDGTYTPASRIQLPESLRPQTEAGQMAADILPFLINPASRAPAAAGNIAERVGNLAARATAESAVGSLAQNSNNQNLGQATEDTLKDLGINAGIGAGVRGVTSALGAGYRAIKGSIAPETEQAIKFAEQNNAPLMTTDVIRPGTFAGNSARALGEKIPITGTGAPRRAQQEARSELVQKYAQQFDTPSPDAIVQSLQRQTSKVKQAAGKRLTQVNVAMQSVGQIVPAQAVTAIDNEIGRLSRLGSAADTQTIGKLQTYRDELSKGADFGLLRDLRTQFRQDVKGDRAAWPNQSQASVNRVYSALTNDINQSVTDNLGPQIANRYKQANSVYANEAQQVNNTRLKNVLQKGDLTPEVVNNLLFSSKLSEVRVLYNSLDAKGKSAARASVIGKAFEKSGGSPDKFLNEATRLSGQTGILFKGQERQYLEGMKKYLESTRHAARSGVVTPTGQELFQIAVPAGVASDVVGTGGVGTATALSYGAVARAYESRVVRNAMLRLANTPRDSSAFESNLQAVGRAVSAAAQGVRSSEGN